MVVIFNLQNSHLLTLSLPTEEVFLVRFEPASEDLCLDGRCLTISVCAETSEVFNLYGG